MLILAYLYDLDQTHHALSSQLERVAVQQKEFASELDRQRKQAADGVGHGKSGRNSFEGSRGSSFEFREDFHVLGAGISRSDPEVRIGKRDGTEIPRLATSSVRRVVSMESAR
ncbi:MAG: hypothetical protein ACR2PG_12985 [Hyphomicrobiaceae bacterium]